jgi:methionyl-tRNA formyltransferase
VPTLDLLLAGPHEVVAVVSQPDRPRGRGRTRQASPVAQRASEAGVQLLRPERVAAPEAIDALRETAPEIGVVVAFGQFLPRRVRSLPARGYLINAHASLLPRYRGAAPIVHAILGGETQTGISVMRVEREMDAGPVLLSRELAIGSRETAGELSERLAALAAQAIDAALVEICAGRDVFTPQDAARVSFAPKITTADAWIDWRRPATAVANQVRAMAPAPGARSNCHGQTLRILAAHPEPGPSDRPPGRVRIDADAALRVATGEGWLVVTLLQRAGGVPLDTAAYLRGRPIADGTQLDSPALPPAHC